MVAGSGAGFRDQRGCTDRRSRRVRVQTGCGRQGCRRCDCGSRRRAGPFRFVFTWRRHVFCHAPSRRDPSSLTMSGRRLAILGSTGSIGTQALDVVARHPDSFEVVALAAGRNTELLYEQARRFRPKVTTSAEDGPAGLQRVAAESDAEIVLAATDGSVAFEAVFAAAERGIDIAIANKELIVAAGELLVQTARASGSRLLPVDSEHSAIFQCLIGE